MFEFQCTLKELAFKYLKIEDVVKNMGSGKCIYIYIYIYIYIFEDL